MKHFIIDKLKNNTANILLLTLAAVFYLTVGCPLRYFLGISCAGCGMSRAVIEVMKLNFSAAYEMHPLVFLLPVAIAVYFLRKRIRVTIMRLLIISALILMLVTYLLRMFSDSTVVYCSIESGLFYKFFHNLLN